MIPKKYRFAVLALLMNAAFHSIGVHAQGGMVAVPSFGDPPKKQTPAQPAQQPTPAAPPAAQPSQPPVRATPAVPPPGPTPQVIRPVTPAPTAQPLPPPTAQPLPPPPAQPLPTVNVENNPSNCSEDNVLSVIRKAFERPRSSSDHYGKPIPNIADIIRKDGKTVQSGIEVCRQQGLQTFSDVIKTSYKREISDRGAYFREVNPGPLREQFRNLINQERTAIFRAEEERRKQDELRAAEERRKQDELRAAEERRKNPKVQAVYFIDGTNSAYKQRNLFHQMSRAVNPINESMPTGKGYLRILSGISTVNAEGSDDLYSLAAQAMLEDVTNNGVNEIYLLGFSRGAIVALNLTKDICGEGSANIKINYHVTSNWWGRSVSGTDKPASEFLMICEKIKAVVLIDPVNTFMPKWSSVASERLKPNTKNIVKADLDEHVLSTASIQNIKNYVAIPNLNHGEMMCGRKQTTGYDNLVDVKNEAVAFLARRGLRINKFNLQTCFKFDGAWPPGIYRQENSTLTFTRGESPTNWELNTW